MTEINIAPLEAFDDCFLNLLKRCNKSIQVGGGCFEYKYNFVFPCK
jgi:hypothetical protein